MKIEIANGKLKATIDFLYGLNLVRKQSRYRRRFINIMTNRLKTAEEDRVELCKEHSRKDENGEAIIIDGNYDIIDKIAFSNDLKELDREVLVIEGGDNREMIRTMKTVLKKFEDVEYEGQDSEIYDYLCDQFEIDEEESKEEVK